MNCKYPNGKSIQKRIVFERNEISFQDNDTLILKCDTKYGWKMKTEFADSNWGFATFQPFFGPVNITFKC